MAWMSCTSRCFGCNVLFTYNPDLVPSIRDPKTGSKEPICQSCVDTANPRRIANGLEPIRPLPGAYEPVEVL